MSRITELKTACGILAATVKTTYHVNWLTYEGLGQTGLEDIFKNAYGKPIQMTECSNDTYYSWDIKKGTVIDEYNRKAIDERIEKGYFEYYYLRWFLIDLVNKNIIPAGHYVVCVSW